MGPEKGLVPELKGFVYAKLHF